MIRVIQGPLGAGKSLYSAMDIFRHLCDGKTVCTNIDVQFDEMAKLAFRDKRIRLDPRQLRVVDLRKTVDFHEVIPFGTQDSFIECFFDEIHLWFNSRDWQQTNLLHKRLLSFLTQSRKACVNITFITQRPENLDRQFRSMSEWIECIVPSSHMPLGIVKSLPWRFFFIVFKDAENGNVIKKAIRGYDKRFFKTYKSYQFLDSDMSELAENAERVGVYKLPKVPVTEWLTAPVRSGLASVCETILSLKSKCVSYCSSLQS